MLENKKKNKSSKINESNRISIWKILAAFVVVNLVVINFINYLQPNSNLRLKNNEQKKNATMAAYDLQNSLNQFKVNPDSYAYLLIQKSVELTGFVNNIEISNSNIKTDAQNLSQNIEQLVAKIPSLKLFQQQVEKVLRVNKNLKQTNLENLENLENSKVTTKIFNTINFTKNLFLTEEKIDNILQILKYNYWLSEDLITKYQNNIEEIGLEIDQLINTSLNNNINLNLNELFNELNITMPMLLNLAEANKKIDNSGELLINIISKLKNITEDSDKILDERSIIMLTLLFTSLLLCTLIIIATLADKTKLAYKNYIHKKEIYLLSHQISVSEKISESSESRGSADKKPKIQETSVELETIN